MTRKKSMFLFYFSITLAIGSSALYHFTAKSTPSNVNFTVSLLVTYVVAFGIVLLTLLFFPLENGLGVELKKLNWASIGLAVACRRHRFWLFAHLSLRLEFGDRRGAGNVIASLILVPVAIFSFKDEISLVNIWEF